MIQIYLVGALIAVFASLGSYFYGRHDGSTGERLKWEQAAAEQKDKEEQKSDKAAKDREKDRENTKVVYRTITQNVDKIVDRPVYRNICLDDDGLRLANAALAGALSTAREPDRRLRAPDSVNGRKLGDRP